MTEAQTSLPTPDVRTPVSQVTDVEIQRARPRVPFRVRQSDLKTWSDCPLKFRWEKVDGLQRQANGSRVFGSIMHDCVLYLETTKDLSGAVARFERFWRNPHLWNSDPNEFRIDYYVRGTSWVKFNDKGPDILRHWWDLIEWESDAVLAREHYFEVPIGDGHLLTGTVDKLIVRWHAATEQWIVLISDYKTNNKTPTYDYLAEDLQFSAYAYASTRPEFWAPIEQRLGLEPGFLWERYKNFARYGEWVQLTSWRRMDAGIREERHYNRLIMAVNDLVRSIQQRIFVPNISGESCRYCDFRAVCGLPELMDDQEEEQEQGWIPPLPTTA